MSKRLAMLRRLRGRSLREIGVRIQQVVRARLERGPAGDVLRRLSRTRGLAIGGTVSPATRPAPAWLASPGAAARLACELARLDASLPASERDLVHRLRDGRLSLLGFVDLDVGAPPRWHRDASSGLEAPRVHWSRVPYLDAALVGDHKVTWEVNRHQYLVAVARCWLVDRRPEDFALVEAHLRSWLDDNPTHIGINWASSLEVALRAISWCWLLWLLRDAPWQSELVDRLGASLEDHALHVERNLSTYFSPNTHLTGEALGLLYVSVVLPESRHARRWWRTGAAILERALSFQVLADGVYFEQATQYQRYTIEIYLHYRMLATVAGVAASLPVEAALRSLFGYLGAITDARGCMPLIGDDDGGLLMPFDARPPDDVGGLLHAGHLLYPDLGLAGGAPPAASLACWLLGAPAQPPAQAQLRATPGWTSRLYPAGGMAVIRDGWHERSAVAVIDGGAHGMMNCAHGHADALAMTLSLADGPLFIDRGTHRYVGSTRNEFRQTASHNTMEFGGESSVTPLTSFQWGAIPPRPTCTLRAAEGYALFRGCAQGHVDSGARTVHERSVIHTPDGDWVIRDSGDPAGRAGALVRWQLHPDCDVESVRPGLLLVRGQDQVPLAWLWVPLAGEVRIGRRDVALRYGAATPAPVIEVIADARCQALTVVAPIAGAAAAAPDMPVAEVDGAGDTWRFARNGYELGEVAVGSIGLPVPGRTPGLALVRWQVAAGSSRLAGAAEAIIRGAHATAAPRDRSVAQDPTVAMYSRRAGGDAWMSVPLQDAAGWLASR